MAAKDPTTRVLSARIAAHTRWSRERDRTEATAAARGAALERFEREVDPSGTLDQATRSTLAQSARQAYFARLALASVQARRARRGGAQKS